MSANLNKIRKNTSRILGMNEKMWYVKTYNKKAGIANSKLKTKLFLEKRDLPVPKTIKVLSTRKELESLDWSELPAAFVMKPARGTEGKGIEIILNRKDDYWIISNGRKIDENYLRLKAQLMLDGKFSIGSKKDRVIIEERIKPHKAFRYHTYKGTPDIRVLLFKSVPIMAMLRLPTKESDGKANLAQGAIGAAIDLAAGRVTNAIYKDSFIERMPHNAVRLSGLEIPYWNKILKIASKVQQEVGLGYLSVDFLIDRNKGPLVLEINSNTGLVIQKANLDGIKWRIKSLSNVKIKNSAQAVRLGKDLFGGQIEASIQNISGRNIVGSKESIELSLFDKTKTYNCIVNTTRRSSRINKKLLADFFLDREYAYIESEISRLREEGVKTKDAVERINEYLQSKDIPLWVEASKLKTGFIRRLVKFDVELAESSFEISFLISEKIGNTAPVELGTDQLNNFIIDPTK